MQFPDILPTIKKELEGLNAQDACSKDATDARKHALALLLPTSKKKVAAVESEDGIMLEWPDADCITCRRCSSTDRYVKYGIQKNKEGLQQPYIYKNGHKFTLNLGFEGRCYYPNGTITKALRLFLGAISSKEAAGEMNTCGFKPDRATVCRWAADYA